MGWSPGFGLSCDVIGCHELRLSPRGDWSRKWGPNKRKSLGLNSSELCSPSQAHEEQKEEEREIVGRPRSSTSAPVPSLKRWLSPAAVARLNQDVTDRLIALGYTSTPHAFDHVTGERLSPGRTAALRSPVAESQNSRASSPLDRMSSGMNIYDMMRKAEQGARKLDRGRALDSDRSTASSDEESEVLSPRNCLRVGS